MATNTTEAVLEESENHTLHLITGEVNSTVFEYTVDKTLLWHYNDFASEFNRTITLVSTIITAEGNSTHLFGLNDFVEHEDYNLTIGTILYPLDSETYNRSITTIKYIPVGEKEITSSELVDFNTSVTLSQLYSSLSKVINKLGKTYERSEDAKLAVFAERYFTMADETNLLSRLVTIQIPEYNKNILNSTVVITDGPWCDFCSIYCPGLWLLGCIIACFFTWGAGCIFCATYGIYVNLYGCSLACVIICAGESGTPPFWVSSIYTYSWYGGAWIDNPGNLVGPNSDDQIAHLHCMDRDDQAVVVGYMNDEATGDIYIYGCSGPGGYYSDLYVYVSNDNQNWDWVNTLTIDATSQYEIYIGYVSSPFRYIAICGYDDPNSVCLYLDAVSVVP